MVGLPLGPADGSPENCGDGLYCTRHRSISTFASSSVSTSLDMPGEDMEQIVMKSLSLVLVKLLVIGMTLPVIANERPNIVFVYTDDQAPTAIGIDNVELKTPHMDRLFREGARLANSFVTTPPLLLGGHAAKGVR